MDSEICLLVKDGPLDLPGKQALSSNGLQGIDPVPVSQSGHRNELNTDSGGETLKFVRDESRLPECQGAFASGDSDCPGVCITHVNDCF